MKLPVLVRMANEVAAFFHAYPDEEARAGIRKHIDAYWTPRMRATLRAGIRAGDAALDPLAAEALRAWATAEESPAERGTPSPVREGAMASDAG